MGYDVPMDVSLPVITYSQEEQDLIFKYRSLLPVGKETVDAVLEVQYQAYLKSKRKLHKRRVTQDA